ncbi:MAG: GNAT family N-acetyltransferase [Candidatus Bathyarchaeota archaeon]|nr:MAG: GNAT family N-acetyltransferase [Candidatus Bathyarchaeota archaeon]
MLNVRRFVQGEDEPAWVSVWNAVYGTRWDWRSMTVEEMAALEKAPDFDAEGRFIAELDGQPVGIVFAYVDKLREEKRGFVRSFGVIPTHRGQGIEEKLADTALGELKKRGMKVAQSSANDDQEEVIHLWESLGFKLVRIFSLMTSSLAQVQSTIDENLEVALRPAQKDADEDLKMINWLDNECFKEHFNWRPNPVEQTIHFVREDPFFKQQEWFFALSEKKHVGYIGLGVDEKYNVERNTKCGWILDIGVLKPHRRRGIGTRLMLHGMRRLKAMGMTTAMLGVDDWNVTEAMKLYEKAGFKVAKKDMAYEKDLE